MKASEVKNFGQLEQFLNEKAKGVEIGWSTWSGFSQLEKIARQVDERFSIRRDKYTRSNEQSRDLYCGKTIVGGISFKKTSDGKFKKVSVCSFYCDEEKSWLDAVSADEQRKEAEEAKAVELLKGRGFENLDELISYINEFPTEKRDKIKMYLRTY